jgi:hypothetical protein
MSIGLFTDKGNRQAQVLEAVGTLSPDAIEKALAMKMSKNVQQAISCANPYPEG